jgi:LysR family glycine cleavage system transcriptional activator
MVYPLLSIDWLPKFASPPSWRDWFKANSVECSQLHDSHRVFSLSAVAIQAAIAGQGFVLAQYSMIEQDIEAGRLVMPLSRPLPMPASYFLTWTKSAFDHDHCRQFHRWLVARGREQSERNLALFADAGE